MLGLDFTRTQIRADRSLFSYSKVQQVVASCIRNRRAFARSPADGAYLDIGCGPNINKDYCNLDWEWRPGVDLCWDITKGLPLNDSSISGIFTEHCLEHIEFAQCQQVMREMYRTMKPGGYVRIVVPDAELYFDQYRLHKEGGAAKMPYAESDPIGGVFTPTMSINRIMHAHGHRFIYDFETMASLLGSVGFRGMTKQCFGKGADPKLLIDTPSRAIESLYVEARR